MYQIVNLLLSSIESRGGVGSLESYQIEDSCKAAKGP